MSEPFAIKEIVLDPPIMSINGRNYRNITSDNDEIQNNESFVEDTEILEDSKGFFETELDNISELFFPFIIGKAGNKINELRRKYNVDILMPPRNSGKKIKIKSQFRANILEAIKATHQIVENNKSKIAPNYFISIPLNTSEIIDEYTKFQNDILSSLPHKTINEGLFVSPKKLHITILMVSIFGACELAKVSEFIGSIISKRSKELLDGIKLNVTIKGVDTMEDDPSNTRVLYGIVKDNESILQKFVDLIVSDFRESSFQLKSEGESVKMHVTFMKNSYNKKNCTNFNSTDIIRKYSNHTFGNVEIKKIHLSNRYKTDPTTGYYFCESEYSL